MPSPLITMKSKYVFSAIATVILAIAVPVAAMRFGPELSRPTQMSAARPSLADAADPAANLESLFDSADKTIPPSSAEPLSVTLNQRFAYSNALERLDQISDALQSFQSLTTASQSQLDEASLTRIRHTDWETQTLGFANWIGSVEGTLRYQDLQIRQLEWQLAQAQVESGELDANAANQKYLDYQQALADFQVFLETFAIAD